ncbi:MAG TPA: hypothetical protein VK470_00410 [Bacteroidota bacterium]|nr:hypothetical protein [Bacteroidota bacterium]
MSNHYGEQTFPSSSARWIARDALRELTDPKTRMRNVAALFSQ